MPWFEVICEGYGRSGVLERIARNGGRAVIFTLAVAAGAVHRGVSGARGSRPDAHGGCHQLSVGNGPFRAGRAARVRLGDIEVGRRTNASRVVRALWTRAGGRAIRVGLAQQVGTAHLAVFAVGFILASLSAGQVIAKLALWAAFAGTAFLAVFAERAAHSIGAFVALIRSANHSAAAVFGLRAGHPPAADIIKNTRRLAGSVYACLALPSTILVVLAAGFLACVVAALLAIKTSGCAPAVDTRLAFSASEF